MNIMKYFEKDSLMHDLEMEHNKYAKIDKKLFAPAPYQFISGYCAALDWIKLHLIVTKTVTIENPFNPTIKEDSPWIPIDEQLPDFTGAVLCRYDNGTIKMIHQSWKDALMADLEWDLTAEAPYGNIIHITHWAKIPEFHAA